MDGIISESVTEDVVGAEFANVGPSKMRQRIAYALGAMGHDAYYGAISYYFIAYVTSTMFAGTPHETQMIALVTTMVMVIRLVEILFDPLIGSVIDNTHTRWGKFKPWLIVSGLMSAIMIALMFSNFFGLTRLSNTTPFIIVFALSFIILDAFYSFKDIAFWSMIPALSASNQERETLGTFARFGSAIGGQGIAILVVPLTYFFTRLFTGQVNTQGASGWQAFGIFVALVSGLTALIAAFGTKEQDSLLRSAGEKTSLKDVFRALFKNDQLMWLSLSYLLFAVAYQATMATLILYFTFVLGHAALYSIVGVIGFIGSIALVPTFPILAKKFGRRRVLTGAILCMILGYIIFTISATTALTIVGLIFFLAPYQIVFLSVLMTITDAVEYGQWKNGVRHEAVTLAMRPLLDKVAGAFSNGIFGFVAIAAGMTGATYDPNATYGVAQYRLYSLIIPAILMAISLTIYRLKVQLTEQRHQEIVAELESRYNENSYDDVSDLIDPSAAV